jgi:hypothetical protein
MSCSPSFYWWKQNINLDFKIVEIYATYFQPENILGIVYELLQDAYA